MHLAKFLSMERMPPQALTAAFAFTMLLHKVNAGHQIDYGICQLTKNRGSKSSFSSPEWRQPSGKLMPTMNSRSTKSLLSPLNIRCLIFASVLSLFTGSAKAEVDFIDILKQAAAHIAADAGTEIDTSQLADGFCFSAEGTRQNQSGAADSGCREGNGISSGGHNT